MPLKMPRLRRNSPDPFGFALPLERVVPLLITIGLTVFNLQFETKDTPGAEAAKWGLAGLQFLLIILLLFKNNTKLLIATLIVSLVSIAPAYFRFEDHENVRLTYLITQGLVSLGLLGLTIMHQVQKNKILDVQEKGSKIGQLQAQLKLNEDVAFEKTKEKRELQTKDPNSPKLVELQKEIDGANKGILAFRAAIDDLTGFKFDDSNADAISKSETEPDELEVVKYY